MPSKRWVEEVEAHCLRLAKYGRILDGPAMLRSEAATLLARQHKEFMELVKKQKQTGKHPVSQVAETQEWMEGYFHACNDILAALQQGGKK